MIRRISTAALIAITALFLSLSLTVNWAYTEIFTTSRFVNTAQQISDEPTVEAEISQALVNAFMGDSSLPPAILIPLQKAANEIVASDAFHTFWSNALWDIHQPLVQQLKSNAPLTKVSAVRVDLTTFVNTLLQDIRVRYPKFASVLPETAPFAEFQLLDGKNLENARSAVRLLTATRWILIILTLLLLVVIVILHRKKSQPIRTAFITIAAGSTFTFLTAFLLPQFASSFVSTDNKDAAESIAADVVQSLRTQSLIVMLLAVCVVGASTLLHRRGSISTP